MNLKLYRKKTAYELTKTTKMNNFSYLNKTCCQKGQTVITGDSITEIFNMDFFCDYTKSSGLAVYNRGISGDTADRLLERFEDNVLALEPKNIVLLIGTNDLTAGADEWYIADMVERIVDIALDKCADVKFFIQSVYPVEYQKKKKNAQIIKLNGILKRLCERKGLEFIDVFDALCDEQGGFDKKYTYDGLHPNAVGFKVVADEIIKHLQGE